MAATEERNEAAAFDPKILGRMRGTARVAGAIVLAVAVLVLIGWALNVEVLRSVIPGLTAMNPGGSALAFLLAGGSLWCLTTPARSSRMTRVARAMAAAVIAITLLRLVLYTFGLEWGPDQWLFRAKLDMYLPPNRMAPNTALGLLLVGIALLVLDIETRRGIRPAQWLALGIALLSLFALIGYVCNVAILIGIQSFIPMALNSAVTLALLATGLLLARPDCGLMAVVCHRESGGVMARKLLPASILAPAALAWLASAGQHAEFFGPSFGVSLFVVSTIVLFTTLIWWNARSLNRIDAEKTLAQKDLGRKSAILESVLNSMGDGVVVADRDGRFLVFNPVAERILGLGALDVPPEAWTSQYGLFSPESGEPLKLDEIPLVRAIRGESTDQRDLLIKNPQLPEGVNISVTGRPLKGDEGIEGGVVVFQDTTQRRRADEAIRRARDEADAANRAKSEFLANMSHEIRTPMNAIIGMTELVLDCQLEDTHRAYLNIVRDSAESLLSLINDILDFSKIEAGKLELDRTAFRLRDMLGDTMKTLAVRARGKDLELACHVASDVPEFLMGDPHRLRQVVTNLVGNALKFTEHGEVVLDVSLEERSVADVRIHFAVRDTGIGIPADKLHLLFSAFSQVDASTTRRYGGTGLGLAITARLVPLMNGRTWVESVPGKGSTFHFTSQFERDYSPHPLPASLESLKGLRVLIVDDNATNCLILQETLTAWFMRPQCVMSAKAALAELCRAANSQDPFRVVLSDVHMPEVDGFELASRIRRDDRFDSTMIMMLSSGAGPEDVARCHELGAINHLIKPIKPSELLGSIAAVMGQVEHREVPIAAVPEPCRSLSILLVEDSEANQQLALGVLRKWGHSLKVASNGREAVEEFLQGKFDVVLMDVQMPEVDGLQATARIRDYEQQRGGHVPIIAMTAHAMKGDREVFIRAGMDDYVTKPIRWPDLRQALDSAVQRFPNLIASIAIAPETQPVDATPVSKDAMAEGATPQAATSPPISLVEPREWTLEWEEALLAVDGNQELLCDVLEELLKEWPKLLAELNRAATVADIVPLKRAVHTIRGSLQLFGNSDAVQLAKQIEMLAQSDNAAAVVERMAPFDQQVHCILSEIKRWLDWKQPANKCSVVNRK